YYCIIGYGNASFIEDMAEKKELMNIIMEKGSGKNSWDFPEAALEKTAIIKIEITAMTGKKSQL
ncbi:MAG TPA: pyridoxamine 5'-phosphate oxidase family protein, partial [Firmicutes bacterium]|nr:pyridoxamine 5'-phosphate oxidase family protein [Bacillota bacterium]